MEKLLITMGLPGSGKTTFANAYCKEYRKKKCSSYRKPIKIIHFDDDLNDPTYRKYDRAEAIKKIIKYRVVSDLGELIFDGMFLTNEDILKLIHEVLTICEIKNVEIHYWHPDIESCLVNDRYRRDINSEITIKNAKLEYPKIKNIESVFSGINFKVVKHSVCRKLNWQLFVDKYHICVDDRGIMVSEGWCLGGTWSNCWGEGGTVSPSQSPTTYRDFDDLLMEVSPDITFLQYKRLWEDSVSTDTYNRGDYYGGNCTYAYFACDIKLLYNKLVEMGLINENNL